MLVAILANDVATVSLKDRTVALMSRSLQNSMEIIEMFFRVSGAMEGVEEYSEAQESDSGSGDPCKVEENFRLCHELYIKPRPLRKQQVNLSVTFFKKNPQNFQTQVSVQ